MIDRDGFSPQARGVAMVCTGVLLLSPDGLIVRLLSIDEMGTLFWRGVATVCGYSLLLLLTGRRVKSRIRSVGRVGLIVACLTMIGNMMFVISISNTSAAHALVILASAPVFTAAISWTAIAEDIPTRTWATSLVVLGGVISIFAISPEAGELGGDLAALCGAISLATLFVLVRLNPHLDMVAVLALGGILTALVSLPFADPLPLSGDDALLIICWGVLLPAALVLVTRGPRYLAAPTVSLLLLIETVFGPIWIWLFAGEEPAMRSILVGILIVGALAANAILAQRELAAQVPAETVSVPD